MPERAAFPGPAEQPQVVERSTGLSGGELVLRRAGPHYEVISNGVFLMDTRDGRSEREMVRAALADLPGGGRGARVLIGGLGVGFSVREALADPGVSLVHVVEMEPRIVEWHRGPLAETSGHALRDPRCAVECADIVEWLAEAARRGSPRFDAVCLDVDNGPQWTVVYSNERLYRGPALDRLADLLRPGGVLSFWSAATAPAFAALLGERFGTARTIEIPVARGEPDVVYLARNPPAGERA